MPGVGDRSEHPLRALPRAPPTRRAHAARHGARAREEEARRQLLLRAPLAQLAPGRLLVAYETTRSYSAAGHEDPHASSAPEDDELEGCQQQVAGVRMMQHQGRCGARARAANAVWCALRKPRSLHAAAGQRARLCLVGAEDERSVFPLSNLMHARELSSYDHGCDPFLGAD